MKLSIFEFIGVDVAWTKNGVETGILVLGVGVFDGDAMIEGEGDGKGVAITEWPKTIAARIINGFLRARYSLDRLVSICNTMAWVRQ